MIVLKLLARLFLIVCLAVTFVSSDIYAPVLFEKSVAEAQEKKKRGFFQRLFGRKNKRKRAADPVQQRRTQTTQRRATSKPQVTATLPKIEDANRIVVIGDQTANAIATGLIEAYKRTPSVEVAARVQDDVAIINETFYSWLDASDFTFLGDRVRAVVIALGTFDRFPIRDGDRRIAFGTKEWERTYRRRLVDITAQLQLLSVPVVWVLPPPVINDEQTERAVAVGTVQQAALSLTNFQIVNVVDGFTNDDGKFRVRGASITGSRVLLRQPDGVGFTKRGADKLAYFVRREIDIILDESLNSVVKLEGVPTTKKRTSQQVVNLTRPALRPNAKLSGENGRFSAFYSDKKARRFFAKGEALEPPKGRADNFWRGEKAKRKEQKAPISSAQNAVIINQQQANATPAQAREPAIRF